MSAPDAARREPSTFERAARPRSLNLRTRGGKPPLRTWPSRDLRTDLSHPQLVTDGIFSAEETLEVCHKRSEQLTAVLGRRGGWIAEDTIRRHGAHPTGPQLRFDHRKPSDDSARPRGSHPLRLEVQHERCLAAPGVEIAGLARLPDPDGPAFGRKLWPQHPEHVDVAAVPAHDGYRRRPVGTSYELDKRGSQRVLAQRECPCETGVLSARAELKWWRNDKISAVRRSGRHEGVDDHGVRVQREMRSVLLGCPQRQDESERTRLGEIGPCQIAKLQ